MLYLGAVGYGVAVLFVLQGGPDLALTQFLVETLTLVLFVFVLRRLPRELPRRRGLRLSQAVRVGDRAVRRRVRHRGGPGRGSGAAPHPPASQAYLDRRCPTAAGSNVVNVVLVDFRGFDTLGEITVLAVAAMGVASLVLAGRGRAAKNAAGESALTAVGGQARDRGDA